MDFENNRIEGERWVTEHVLGFGCCTDLALFNDDDGIELENDFQALQDFFRSVLEIHIAAYLTLTPYHHHRGALKILDLHNTTE